MKFQKSKMVDQRRLMTIPPRPEPPVRVETGMMCVSSFKALATVGDDWVSD